MWWRLRARHHAVDVTCGCPVGMAIVSPDTPYRRRAEMPVASREVCSACPNRTGTNTSINRANTSRRSVGAPVPTADVGPAIVAVHVQPYGRTAFGGQQWLGESTVRVRALP